MALCFTTREEIAQSGGTGRWDWRQVGDKMLKSLSERNLLRREQKKYLPADLARSHQHQGTLAEVVLNRHKLGPDLVQKIRDSYRRSQKCLQTMTHVSSEEDISLGVDGQSF